MHVSIIVPTYNGEKYLRETLQSVLNQTFPDWELLISDDGSKDSSVAIAEEFARKDSRIKVAVGKNRGKVAVCNEFLKTATGDYVAILDHDDIYKPKKLELQVKYMEAHPEAGMVFCGHEVIDGKGNVSTSLDEWITYPRFDVGPNGRRIAVSDDDPWMFRYLLVNNCVPMLTHLIRREAAVATGPFDPESWPSDDWDYWLRFSRLHQIHKIPEVLASYRFHDSNFTLNWGKMGVSRQYVSRKLKADQTLTEVERKQYEAAVKADCYARADDSSRWARSAFQKGDIVGGLRYSLRSVKIHVSYLTGERLHS